MAILRSSKVFRGGVTADYLTQEAAVVHGECYATGVISVRTAIASKGGGFTEVRVQLSPVDVDHLITESIRLGGLSAAERMTTCLAKAMEALSVRVT